MSRIAKQRRQLRRHFFKEWRQHRGLTQEQAAARIDIDRTTLGRIESLKIAYTQQVLEAVADAYMCEPWDLLNVDPGKEGEVIDLSRVLKEASAEQRADVLGYIKGRLAAK